jgi:outer membrane protein assembly factor BamB
MIDAASGKAVHKFAALKKNRDWGFVATRGGLLLGTDQRHPINPRRGQYSYGHTRLYDARQLLSTPVVGDNFHAHDVKTRQQAWSYDENTVILHQSIAASDDTIFFAESANPEAVQQPSGTPKLSDFTARSAAIVALDLRTGKQRWRRPLGPLSEKESDVYEHVLYLSFSDGKLLMTRTGHVDGLISYRISQIDADSGKVRWMRTIRSEDSVYAPLLYGKNMQQNRPAIIGNRIYLLAHQFHYICMDFETGKVVRRDDFEGWQDSKTCAIPTASASALFFRQNSAFMYDIASDRRIDLTRVTRPSCWMSMVPAGGLLMMPEASSGCTCGFAMQMSMALAPVKEVE